MSLPELFGAYLLHHRLAQGTTSEVFLAQTTGEYPRICAVKRILPGLAALPEFPERFRRDAALLVRLTQGNLVQVLEVGAVEERPFVAMELIDGIELEELIGQVPEQGPLPPELALYLGLEVCEALSYLHLRRREESGATLLADSPWPLEAMLAFDGVVKVVDLGGFGALRLGQQPVDRVLHSPGYSSPEVIHKRPLDARSDLFAVGVMLWEILAGRRLIADPEGYVRAVLAGDWCAPLLVRKDATGDVIRLVSELLSLDPERRPTTVEEVRRRLVEGLRRVAPTYGSAALSQLLWRRCRSLIGRHEQHIAELVQRTSTEPKRAGVMRTATYGRAGEPRRVLAPAPPLQVGDPIPGTRYRMVRALGRGGCAEVYAAQHVDLDRQVAIKIISPQLAVDDVATTQFRLEARACSRVRHPNIVDVIDFGELTDGRFFFAMELLEGQSLAEVLSHEGALSPERAVGIFRQIVKALGAAHDQGIVHRDLKPENVMLIHRDGRDDFVKVLDFGVMALASEERGQRVGTAGYMAPEQSRGEKPSSAMDIYGVGTTLYEALAGELPYCAESLDDFVRMQAEQPPPALRSRSRAANVPAALERVVQRALERDPKARHPSMADLEADLIRAQHEAGLQTEWDDLPPPGQVQDQRAPSREVRPSPRRGGRAWIAALALGVGLASAGGLVLWRTRQPSPKPPAKTTPIPRPASPVESPVVQDLLRRVDAAAAVGRFTHPPGENAFDLLRELDRQVPGSGRTAEARRRLARSLSGAADRLIAAGLPRSARTLYEEALLFDPTLPLPAEGRALAPSSPPRRPEADVAEVAWLLSQVQIAVAEGRYVRPPQQSALHFLERLRRVDPSGAKTAEARKVMTGNLRRKADDLWQRGEVAAALPLYQMVLLLDPSDAIARGRSRPAVDAGVPRVTPRVAAKPAVEPVDPARAGALVIEGRQLLGEGKLAEARRRFMAAIAANPKDPRALTGLASIAFEESQYTKTIELARRSLAMDRRQVQAHLLLGDAYFKLLRHDDAVASWQEVLKLDATNRSATRRIAKVRQEK
jgi:serine/threonine protein kinase/tetratricopeptide (TPR) repeat protein